MSMRLAFVPLAFALSLPAAAGTVMRDDFSSAASGWPNAAATQDSDLGFAVYTDSGKYQMTPVKDEVFGFIATPKQAAGNDATLEADVFLYAGIGAGAGGLGCRWQDHSNFYAFMARGDATLMILKIAKGEVSVLAQGKVQSVMPGAVDTRMTASCIGTKLTLRASNGATLNADDATFAAGQTGVFVIGEKLAGTSVTFDNLVLTDGAP